MRSYFNELTTLEKIAKGEIEGYSLEPAPKALVFRFCKFLENASLTSSENDTFMCKNFRLSYSELASAWDKLHPMKKKTADCWRTQMYTFSIFLSSLLGCSPVEFTNAFIQNDEERLYYFSCVLDAYDYEDIDFTTRYSFLIDGGFVIPHETDSVYDLSDCTDELVFLKTVDKSVVEDMLSHIDLDKLAYLLSVAAEPLIERKRVPRSAEHGSRVPVASVSQSKLELIKALGLLKPKGFERQAQSDVTTVVIEQPVVEPEPVWENPYTLEISQALTDLISAKESTGFVEKEEARWSQMTEHERDLEKLKVAIFFQTLTLDGFRQKLNGFSHIAVREVLAGNYKIIDSRTGEVVAGKTPRPFKKDIKD